MRLAAMPHDVQQALAFATSGVDGIVVGHKDLSLRCARAFSWAEIAATAKGRGAAKLFVLANRFFFEPDLRGLAKNLTRLAALKVDGVYFQDYAVPQLVRENGLGLPLIYHPETLVVSYGQLPFYARNGFSRAVLARELFKSEVAEICKNRPHGLELEIQAHGFPFVMHSRWKMVSNFAAYANLDLDAKKRVWIREKMRLYPNLLIEDKDGTHMLGGYELCLLRHLNDLAGMGMDWIRIDNVAQDREWCARTAEIYVRALRAVKEGRYAAENAAELWRRAQEATGNPLFAGFMGTLDDNPHLVRADGTREGK